MKKETIAGIVILLMMLFLGIVLIFLCGYFAGENIFPMFLFFILGVLLICARFEIIQGEIEE
jgi:ABC-type multidrug transport system permease subunit